MSDVLERLEVKLDKVIAVQGDQAVTLARQNATLEEHVRRTAILESAVAPLKRTNDMWAGAGKVFALVLGASAALVEVFHALARSR